MRKLKLIMPMCGEGSRFVNAGYDKPKPLIDAGGLPLFVRSVECIRVEFDEKIFLTRQQHGLKSDILRWYPDATVIEIDHLPQGTALTLLYAREHWQDGSSIFIANSDQMVDYDPADFYRVRNNELDAGIAIFDCPEQDPKWSYAEVDNSNMRISRVAEKDPISEWATVGYYYFKDGRVFESAVDSMVRAKDTVNNEYYTCPAYNYLINRTVEGWPVKRMQGLGTPEDLDEFHRTQGEYVWPESSFGK